MTDHLDDLDNAVLMVIAACQGDEDLARVAGRNIARGVRAERRRLEDKAKAGSAPQTEKDNAP